MQKHGHASLILLAGSLLYPSPFIYKPGNSLLYLPHSCQEDKVNF